MTLQSHLEERFRALFAAYRKQWKRCQKDATPDSVHDARVVSRRILETMRACRDVLDASAIQPIEKGLKQWMSATGSVRDLDIAQELVAEWNPNADALLARWIRQRRDKRWQKVEALTGSDKVWNGDVNPKKLIGAQPKGAQSSAWDLSLSAEQNAALALPLLLDRFGVHGDRLLPGEASPSDYHSFRLQTKRIRYTLEAFAEVYPEEPFRKLLSTCKNLQQILGTLHDCEAASKLTAKLAEKHSKDARASDFVAFLERKAASLRGDFHRTWEEFRQPEERQSRRRWLAAPLVERSGASTR